MREVLARRVASPQARGVYRGRAPLRDHGHRCDEVGRRMLRRRTSRTDRCIVRSAQFGVRQHAVGLVHPLHARHRTGLGATTVRVVARGKHAVRRADHVGRRVGCELEDGVMRQRGQPVERCAPLYGRLPTPTTQRGRAETRDARPRRRKRDEATFHAAAGPLRDATGRRRSLFPAAARCISTASRIAPGTRDAAPRVRAACPLHRPLPPQRRPLRVTQSSVRARPRNPRV